MRLVRLGENCYLCHPQFQHVDKEAVFKRARSEMIINCPGRHMVLLYRSSAKELYRSDFTAFLNPNRIKRTFWPQDV